MRRILTFASILLVGLMAQTASAELVMFGGQLTPSELATAADAQAETKYRLIFVTTGSYEIDTADAAYDAAATYDGEIASDIAGGVADDPLYGWKAVVSTASGDRSAAGVLAGSSAIWNMNGDKVGNDGADVLDTSIMNPVVYDWSGDSVGLKTAVWTGSNEFGAPNTPPSMADYRLGGDGASGDRQNAAGLASAMDGDWLFRGVLTTTNVGSTGFPFIQARYYAVSDELTVVPEPSTILLWLGFSGIAGLVYWRKRRS